MLQHKT